MKRTTTVSWMRIEIGYVSMTPDTCSGIKPHLQEVLEAKLLATRIRSWAKVGQTTITGSVTPTSDDWAAEVLATELNTGLQEAHAAQQAPGVAEQIVIEPKHLCSYLSITDCYLSPTMLAPLRKLPTGRPGTHCKLLGDLWINSRSYRITDSAGRTWLESELPPKSLMFATLTWECFKVTKAIKSRPSGTASARNKRTASAARKTKRS